MVETHKGKPFVVLLTFNDLLEECLKRNAFSKYVNDYKGSNDTYHVTEYVKEKIRDIYQRSGSDINNLEIVAANLMSTEESAELIEQVHSLQIKFL
jgi:hypothetical protein